MNKSRLSWKNTPKFWKRIRSACIGIGVSLVAAITANSTLGLNIDAIIIKICQYGVFACALIGGTAHFTRDPKVLEEDDSA